MRWMWILPLSSPSPCWHEPSLTFESNPDNRQVDVEELEQKIIEVAQSWRDGLLEALYEVHGEEIANDYIHLYQNSFPGSYKAFSLVGSHRH